MKIKVEVTQEDIAKGVRADCDFCPVALALRRATGWIWAVRKMRAERFSYFVFVPHLVVALPHVVETFIDTFDKSGEGSPFSFELELNDN